MRSRNCTVKANYW